MSTKYAYFFGGDQTEGNAELRDLLGGKGANLAEMASLGINVPPGFTVTTQACAYYFQNKKKLPPTLWEEILKNLESLQTLMGKEYGSAENPLLLSVRSGARASMPGMMDTILNLGLNDETVKGLAKKTDNEWFAYDCYRRFISMFGNVELGIPGENFESILTRKKANLKIKDDTEFSKKDLKSIATTSSPWALTMYSP